MTTHDRFCALQSAVTAATIAARRDANSVTLIAVSKYFGGESVEQVAATGHTHFGESYAQELKEKATQQPHLDWHFIGRVQTNKASIIAQHAGLVHTIISERHAQAIAKRCESPLRCLIQVNIADEPQKGGVAINEVLALAAVLHQNPRIVLEGLMCIPPASDDPEQTRPHFRALANLAKKGREQGLPLNQLSMGMSRDFAVAIQEGATLVRIGSAIFGERR